MTRLSVLRAIVFIGIGAFGMWVYLTMLKPMPKGTPDIVCYENPDSDLRTGRWKRMYEAERQNVSFLVLKKRAEFREEQSLVCYEYADGASPQRFIVKQQWWRPK